MKKIALCMLAIMSAMSITVQAARKENVVVAYITSGSTILPDPFRMTHINYAFGHVSESFDGVRIDNPARLHAIAALKRKNPRLKVLLSVGGWGSGRFSEMAADEKLRKAFCRDCKRVVEDFGLDGIDIDWEYPGNPGGGISCSDNDKNNFTLLMRDLRSTLGSGRLVTLATAAWGSFYDFPAIMPYVDFVNMMTYDMGGAPRHHAHLYNSPLFPDNSVDDCTRAHLQQGVPAEKLCMGVPFYGRGIPKPGADNSMAYRDIVNLPDSYIRCRDKEACAVYLTDKDGEMVMGYDSPQSLKQKCKYIKRNRLRGIMYWEYASEGPDGALSKAIQRAMKP